MNKNNSTSPPAKFTTLTLIDINRLDNHSIALYEIVYIEGLSHHDFKIGELLTDIEIDDLIEIGFEIKTVNDKWDKVITNY